MPEDFDDTPQWYWAASNRPWMAPAANAEDKFVVACGQRELWRRVSTEVDPEQSCAWVALGPRDGHATLADCVMVMITAREHYGVNFNRVVLELAQIQAFARFLHEAPTPLCNLVSNPLSPKPLSREPYGFEVESRLERAIRATLGLPDEDEASA